MAHKILDTAVPQIKFTEDTAGVRHAAIVRPSIVEPDVLVIATRFGRRTRGATSAVVYLDRDDARALRDFLITWLDTQ